jgi:hypothetical protein
MKTLERCLFEQLARPLELHPAVSHALEHRLNRACSNRQRSSVFIMQPTLGAARSRSRISPAHLDQRSSRLTAVFSASDTGIRKKGDAPPGRNSMPMTRSSWEVSITKQFERAPETTALP